MAPTRCPSAPSAELRLFGVIASGVETPRRSPREQPAISTTPMRYLSFIIYSTHDLEGYVEAEDEVRGGRRRLEIGLGADGRSGVGVALRINARVLRPFVQIARGDDEARVFRAHPRHESLREEPRRGELAEARERAVLHESELRISGLLAHRDRAGLHPQRRVLRVRTETIIPTLTANALRAVQQAVAALVIEQGGDPQLSLEQIEARLQRHLEARRGVRDERRILSERDLIDGDHTVSGSVRERVPLLPVAEQRIAWPVLRRRADLCR